VLRARVEAVRVLGEFLKEVETGADEGGRAKMAILKAKGGRID